MKHGTFTISEGRLPVWRAILSAVLIAGALYFFVMMFLGLVKFGDASTSIFDNVMNCSEWAALGIACGTVRSITISPTKNKIFSRYSFGPIGHVVVSNAPVMEYISVFFTESKYEVNLWYKGNRHYKLHVFNTKEDAFELAYSGARKLNLDILDATVKGNSHWIALSES